MALATGQKRLLGRFLVEVATIGGGVSPEEVKLLANVYGLLGLDAGELHGDIHSLATATAPDDPIVVAPATTARGVPIPHPPGTAGLALDPNLIEQRARETAQVSQLLEAIFSEPDSAAATVDDVELEKCLEGLDAPHSALLRELAGRDSIAREEWAHLVERHGLLPEGALDTVNECALELYDDFICEGDDVLMINQQVVKEML